MKNKIMFRLMLYFISTLGFFAIIVGLLFSFLFSRHNIEIHQAELERRAVSIANTISEMIDSGMGGMGHGMGGLGAYLRFIEDIAMSDVWIVDRNMNEISFGRGRTWQQGFSYINLPDGAEQVVLDAFDGKASVGESFSSIMEVPSITAATPIIVYGDEVIGVVLLHSQIADINAITNSGLLILLGSTVAAVLITIIIAVIMSFHFSKPLRKMKMAALQISGGNYAAKTDVCQSDEIGELAAILDDMANRLDISAKESEKLDKMRRDFVANISHELRTPITVIRGSLEAIRDGIVSDTNKILEYNHQMLNESIYLERLVTDLLDLSRLQNPDFEMEMQNIELKSVLDDVIRGMSRIAEQKNVKVVPMYSGNDTELLVVGDYSRIRQMLVVVLDNAIKFSTAGKEVVITVASSETSIVISVCDKGCGIYSDDLPYIFDRFYKQRSEQNKSGTGLGLPIAKQIADRHDVMVNVSSDVGKGCEFKFIFKKSKSSQN